MGSKRSPISSRKPRREASSSSSRTRSPAAISSGRPSPADLAAARGKKLRDVIAPGVRILFCGINPGLYSAATGNHFARPGNRFWPALHAAGFTPRLFHPSEKEAFANLGYGLTNLVGRATASADELEPPEFLAGRARLARKVRRYRPRMVAFLGMGAYRHAFEAPAAPLGEQPERFEGARVWVLPSPSGLNANYQMGALVDELKKLKRATQA
ncbi:MAG: G/U mismatch-specific DNA glycosylase [Betaproteobacteria bacterium]|nr:G/U mismatch-specific DNA glycosylase [Betaproteobacteria bacterium]